METEITIVYPPEAKDNQITSASGVLVHSFMTIDQIIDLHLLTLEQIVAIFGKSK